MFAVGGCDVFLTFGVDAVNLYWLGDLLIEIQRESMKDILYLDPYPARLYTPTPFRAAPNIDLFEDLSSNTKSTPKHSPHITTK